MRKILRSCFANKLLTSLAAMILVCGCGHKAADTQSSALFSITETGSGYKILVFGTDGSAMDSIAVDKSLNRIVCMSSSYVAYLSDLGCDSVICGISGTRYISAPGVRKRISDGLISEVGQDAMPDYERIAALSPDIVVSYSVPGSDFTKQLHKLGIKVLTLNDYLENNPIGRASYIRIFGALTGRMDMADSILAAVSSRYRALAEDVRSRLRSDSLADPARFHGRPGVLMNIPYADAWYIPGGSNYMTRLVNDAGARMIGAEPGRSESSVISIEQAVIYSQEASFWLNTGWCSSRQDLYSINPVFRSMDIPHIYNNTRRTNAGGGNDFWESGAARPDIILHDLVKIFHPEVATSDTCGLYYYKEVL